MLEPLLGSTSSEKVLVFLLAREEGYPREIARFFASDFKPVVGSLLAWGAGQGARAAYLQVMEENLPARALYVRHGFAAAYRYWYRVAPPPGRPDLLPPAGR